MQRSRVLCRLSIARPSSSGLSTAADEDVVPFSALYRQDDPRPLIKTPLHVARKEYAELARDSERRKRFHSQYGVDRRSARLVIAAADPRLNHYEGQRYPGNKDLPLVSQSWLKVRSRGDAFTINTTGNNPSHTNRQLGDVVREFGDFGLSPDVVANLRSAPLSLRRPTLVQSLAWPPLLAGMSAVVAAETGSGKTLAYAVPLVELLLRGRRSGECRRPKALVCVPGKELVGQTAAMLRCLVRGSAEELRVATPGQDPVAWGDQVTSDAHTADIQEADIVVGSTERLRRLLESGEVAAADVVGVVLDEADTLLDDSFVELSLTFLRSLAWDRSGEAPSGPQLTLVSATFPSEAAALLDDVVDLTKLEEITTPALHRLQPHVPQKFLRLLPEDKPEALLEALKKDARRRQSSLVFVNSHETAEFLAALCGECGVAAGALHGKLRGPQRAAAYAHFQSRAVPVLIATDLGSRGLDTRHVSHVLNYDFPLWMSDFVHRGGRVGRLGSAPGAKITSFIAKKREVHLLRLIETTARRNSLEMSNVDANIKRQIREQRQSLEE